MRRPGKWHDDSEEEEAGSVAVRGGVTGAAKWGLLGAAGALAGYTYSPIYRGLTFQFKIYLQISAMVLGGYIEADHRLRVHEELVRKSKRSQRQAEMWKRRLQEAEDMDD